MGKTITFLVYTAQLVLVAFLCGCTCSLNVINTEGSAQDVVDETQSADPNISPTVSIPAAEL